ncbi:signal peptidase I [Mesobacillus boroniphilus]|uniref:Signal peptidase I n=1 Tax=Mesobacillus boroniphilus TaxID=308892 RepID=A0A944GZL1_9BACI|nr:signal peptidase I [Mesobacillus boroniphilus]MBS8266601.1 signal peptidase I [Mesobacillus boroniphilus]
MKRTFRMIGNAIYWFVFSVFLLMLIMVVSSRVSGQEPELFGYQFKTVLSGSMEPTFKTGSLILVKKAENPTILEKHDVITFRQNEMNIITHRIMEVIKQGENVLYRTKGDHNENEDMNPVNSQNVLAVYSGITIPLVGYLLKYASSPLGIGLLLIIPGLLLLVYSAWTIYQALRQLVEKTRAIAAMEEKQTIIS